MDKRNSDIVQGKKRTYRIEQKARPPRSPEIMEIDRVIDFLAFDSESGELIWSEPLLMKPEDSDKVLRDYLDDFKKRASNDFSKA